MRTRIKGVPRARLLSTRLRYHGQMRWVAIGASARRLGEKIGDEGRALRGGAPTTVLEEVHQFRPAVVLVDTAWVLQDGLDQICELRQIDASLVVVKVGPLDRMLLLRGGLDAEVVPDADCAVLVAEIRRLGAVRAGRGLRGAGERSVLLVDDNEDLIEGVAEMLRRRGYAVICAPDGVRGLECLRTHAIQVVLTDQVMPVLPGTELIAAARRYDPRVVSLITTGAPTLELAARALRHGALEVVMKPVSLHQVVSLVDAARTRWAMGRSAETVAQPSVLRVLLVAADQNHGGEVGRQLDRADFQVSARVRDVPAATAFLLQHSVDVVLFDILPSQVVSVEPLLRLRNAARGAAMVAISPPEVAFGEGLRIAGVTRFVAAIEQLAPTLQSAVQSRIAREHMDSVVGEILVAEAVRESLVARSREGALVVDKRGYILAASPVAATLLRGPGGSVVGDLFDVPDEAGVAHQMTIGAHFQHR